MNIATTAEKKNHLFFPKFLSELTSENPTRGGLLWISLPFFFLLAQMGLAFLKPCAFTAYFPISAILMSALCLRYQGIGFACCFVILLVNGLIFRSQLPQEALWWYAGALCSFLLNLVLFTFVPKQWIQSFETLSSQAARFQTQSQELEKKFESAKEDWQEKEKAFLEEIHRLKEEAKERVIERSQLQRKIELIQSEIELLTENKDLFIDEANQAKRLSEQSQEKLQLLEQEWVKESMAVQERVMRLQSLSSSSSKEAANPKLEGLYKQLRSQFEEKAEILSQTRKELFATQHQLLVFEREMGHRQADPDREEVRFYEQATTVYLKDIERLEEEILILENVLDHLISAQKPS